VIHVISHLRPIPLPRNVLERAATAALAHHAAQGDLTLVLTDDVQIRQLNRDYLGNDAPTDVLAFPASETDPQTGAPYLGDVLISIPRAEEQARAAHHSLQEEAQVLVVHGVLHLLGYDHANPPEKTRMWKVQTQILTRLGLPKSRLPK